MNIVVVYSELKIGLSAYFVICTFAYASYDTIK